MDVWMTLLQMVQSRVRIDERGAVGWLLIGMIVGALLIVGLIIKLLIPGD